MTPSDVRPYDPSHLSGVLRLAAAEGWPSLNEDPERAERALSAPGVTTVVALDERDAVIGFAQLLSDGAIQAYLATIAVDPDFRNRGVGRAMVEEALQLGGGERIDLLTDDEAVGFYETFPHFRKDGFRLYPFHRSE